MKSWEFLVLPDFLHMYEYPIVNFIYLLLLFFQIYIKKKINLSFHVQGRENFHVYGC